MKLITKTATAIAVATVTLLPIKVNSVSIDTNQENNPNKCDLDSTKVEAKTNNKTSNYINFSFNKNIYLKIEQSGIIATFAPKNNTGEIIELKQLASALDYERFAWVNYVEQDPYGIRDRHGKIVPTPYNDPPPGGYQYQGADYHPFYWDMDKCDKCQSRHHYQHPKITSKFSFVFEDHPSDPRLQSGESVNFVTHLVGVKSKSSDSHRTEWEILTTFSWKLSNNHKKQGRVSLMKNNINPSQLSSSLLAQIQADGGKINNSLIAHRYISHNHQHQQQNRQSPHLVGCL